MFGKDNSNHWLAILLMACSLLMAIGCGDEEEEAEEETAIVI